VESYPYPVKEGQQYINLNPGRLFVQQPPKRERDREAHLNYYASAYNMKKQLTKNGKSNKEQKMRKWMDKGGAKAERGTPAPRGVDYK